MDKVCKVKGCKEKVRAKGFCNRHYKQIQSFGKTIRTMHDPNEIEVLAEVVLYDRKGIERARTIIDYEDIDKIKPYKWCYKEGYVTTKIDGKTALMHRVIMNAPDDKLVDHINHNTLDNRKRNLRLCTNKENCRNRQNIKGVYYRKDRDRWKVTITKDRKSIYIGSFENKEDAIKARRRAEIKYFGEFAPERKGAQ